MYPMQKELINLKKETLFLEFQERYFRVLYYTNYKYIIILPSVILSTRYT